MEKKKEWDLNRDKWLQKEIAINDNVVGAFSVNLSHANDTWLTSAQKKIIFSYKSEVKFRSSVRKKLKVFFNLKKSYLKHARNFRPQNAVSLTFRL